LHSHAKYTPHINFLQPTKASIRVGAGAIKPPAHLAGPAFERSTVGQEVVPGALRISTQVCSSAFSSSCGSITKGQESEEEEIPNPNPL